MSDYLYLTDAVPSYYREGGRYDYYDGKHPVNHYPWEADGYLIVGRHGYNNINSSKLWNTRQFQKIDLRTMISDFYLLDAIASCVLVPGSTPQVAANPAVLLEMIDAGFYARDTESPEGVALEAAVAFSRHTLKYAPIVRDYMHYAMCTEISFHEVAYPLGDGVEVMAAWKDLIARFGHEMPARWMIEMFDRGGWSAGFGGKAWAGIAIVAHNYETGTWLGESFGPREFLDRAFSLEHNGGCMFNKANWSNKVSEVQAILNAHANSDWATLHKHASEDTRVLVAKYLDACGVEDHNKLLGIAPPPPPPATFTNASGNVVVVNTNYGFTPNGKTYKVTGEISGLSKGAVVVKTSGNPYKIYASGPKQTTLKPYGSWYEGMNMNTSWLLKQINSGMWTLFSGSGKQYIVPQDEPAAPDQPVEWNHKVGDFLTAGSAKQVYHVTKMTDGSETVSGTPMTHAEFIAEGEGGPYNNSSNGWVVSTANVHRWIGTMSSDNWKIIDGPPSMVPPAADPVFEKLLQEEEAIEASLPSNASASNPQATVLAIADHPPVKIMGTKFAGSKCKITGKSMDVGDPIVYHGKRNGESLGASSLQAWVDAFGKVPADTPNYYKAI